MKDITILPMVHQIHIFPPHRVDVLGVKGHPETVVSVDSMGLRLHQFRVLTVHQILMGQRMVTLLSLAMVMVISVDKEGLQDLTMYQLQVALMEDQIRTKSVALLDPQMHIYLQIPVSTIKNFLEVWAIQDLGEMVSVVHVMVLPVFMTILALTVQIMMLLALDDHHLVLLIPIRLLDQEEVMGQLGLEAS
jgi:hypothetical protein